MGRTLLIKASGIGVLSEHRAAHISWCPELTLQSSPGVCLTLSITEGVAGRVTGHSPCTRRRGDRLHRAGLLRASPCPYARSVRINLFMCSRMLFPSEDECRSNSSSLKEPLGHKKQLIYL